MNVLFHINENGKWKSVLGNVSNMINECEKIKEPFLIEVVSNGEAVMSLKEESADNLEIILQLTQLSKEGVIFAACRNSLNKYAINEGDLISFVQVVPTGVMEIAKKQEAGYSYIKP